MNQLWQQIRTQAIITLGILGGAIILLIGSPLLLTAVNALYSLEWTRLNEIGQSYTGVATLLSGLALVGVAYSIRLQTQQISVARGQAVREMQFGLLRMSMEDPSLELRSPLTLSRDSATHRRQLYYTQWLRYLEFAYLSNEIDDSELRDVLETDLFLDSRFRERWGDQRAHWANQLGPRPEVRQRFLTILNDAYAATADNASSGGGVE